MTKMTQVNIRVEADLKRRTEIILDKLGLTTTQAVTLFFKQIDLRKGLPFDVSIPNAETRRAIADALAGKNLRGAKDADALFDDLKP